MKRPKHLFAAWDKVGRRIENHFTYIFLDYDGTLAPIVALPSRSVMPARAKRAIRLLSKAPGCKVAVVSGRGLEDVRRRVGIKGIVYVGNHGFEIEGPKIRFQSPVPIRYRVTLEEIKRKLNRELASIRGVLIEDKGFSLSVHYRLVAGKNIPAFRAGFYGVLLSYEVRGSVQVRRGKKILEVRPPMDWDKGKVVLWLLARQSFASREKKRRSFPIYVGDDITDEDAFRTLRPRRGLNVFVGKPGRTRAGYYLKNPEEVSELLGRILKLKKGRAS